MATTRITENVITTISKGPLIIFVIFGLGFWQASKMSDEQISTIEKLISVLDNTVGIAIYSIGMLILFYSLILWPVGKFVSTISKEWIEESKVHEQNARTHYEASKALYHKISETHDVVKALNAKIAKYYNGDN